VIDQIVIGLCGVTSIFLSQSERREMRRWACVVGLLAQPFWFWTTWKTGQYGIFALCWLYALSWAKGFHTYWIKK